VRNFFRPSLEGWHWICVAMRIDTAPLKEHLMPGKKKSKGVLERIGDVANSAAEVVVDAGSKAIHAVGDLMPGGSSRKGTKASSKASKKKAPKASRKSSKAPAKSAAKASKPAVDAKTKTVGREVAKPAIKKSTAAKPATRAAKAAPKRHPGKTR
jgi:hypothetical protein